MPRKKEKPIIGKNDIADFPAFGVMGVKVKIDSGAYTSTIHCSKIKEENEKLNIVFLGKKEQGYSGEMISFTEYKLKKVRSSSGEMQERFTVKGDIVLFGKKYKTEFTLSKRNKMRFPVLLGRKLLNNRFLIDTSLTNQSWKQNQERTQ